MVMNKKDIQLLAEQFAAIQASQPTQGIAIISTQGQESNEEVEMVVSNLRQIADQAQELSQFIQGDVEEWVQEKIATCASKINSALNHLKYSQDKCCMDSEVTNEQLEEVKRLNPWSAKKLIDQLTETLPEENKYEYLARVLTDRKYFKLISEPLEQILRAEEAAKRDVMSDREPGL